MTLIVELVQFERQKAKDTCRDAENVKAKEVIFVLFMDFCNCRPWPTGCFVYDKLSMLQFMAYLEMIV